MTPSTIVTPPSMGATPPTPLSGGPPSSFQGNQFMTPHTMTISPTTMITPPSIGGTPPTPSSGESQNFQNPMWSMTPSAYDYTWNEQYGTWDMSQKAGGAPGPQWNQNQGLDNFQNTQLFGNLGNVPQNNSDFPEHDGVGTSSQSGSTDFDFRF
ncbi:hypothetical protein CAEBREN_11117 [Caenorhabditis brenneri]|uniref:Uncharacterized protein n=1 Tax=Caenorhabditis brenneri TaxID=135651 RepID=G0MCY1_CAEBE|nr:hypothetical protein CAEBREN_11117 [Caenorhabditis brenneri]